MHRFVACGVTLLGPALASAAVAPAAFAFAGCPSAMGDAEYAGVLGSYQFTGDSMVDGLRFTVDCVYPGGSLITSHAARRKGEMWQPLETLEGYYDRSSKSIHLPAFHMVVKHMAGKWRAELRLEPDDLYRTVTFQHEE